MQRQLHALLALVLATATGIAATPAAAEYPDKPITIVVGYRAGGGTDATIRAMAEPLGSILGEKILVQNASGGGGAVAATKVGAADPDGYTLIATTSSTYTIEPRFVQTAYKPDDFVHVSILGAFQGAYFTRADKPFASLPELIALAKKEGRSVKYGSFFQMDKIIMNYIGRKEGVQMIPVPVRGGAGAAKAVLEGDVDTAYSGGSWGPLVDSKQAKLLFATTFEPLVVKPDLVSMKGLGYDVGTSSFLVLSAPRGTPADVVRKLAAAAAQAVAAPALQAMGKKRYMDMTARDSEETATLMKTEYDYLTRMIDAAK